ncbi:hypothetical protein Pla8534_38110 [Lignipirellula cremea]|uniref:Right handed beta helix domain-containing protein n=2 Tax=Lignipirellula cremea TaxID=2528010 RepID=A0A518DVX7_9BACT|nr:hypothetical protein Pla8534_38110 [Lignipirellula cremea]
MLASRNLSLSCLSICFAAALLVAVPGRAVEFPSHPPQRPLPVPSRRPLPSGDLRYVSPTGDDSASGEQAQPWRTITFAIRQLQPGQTLLLRGGVYHEHVVCEAQGTAEQPITLRSAPGELAIIDGGLPEFLLQPENAWTPVADGAPHEYRSVRAYPNLGARADTTNLLGAFADSMVPLHGYRFLTDLRSDNEYFSAIEAGKTEAGSGIYCGPGLFYDAETGHIHVRLDHTTQLALKSDNYRGETDPRRLPLIVAGMAGGSPLSLQGARFVQLQDLVVRGSRSATVSVSRCTNITFDGVTSYGGQAAMGVVDSAGLRLWNCALRGIAAPWTYRGSLKYRAIEARIFSASSWAPTGSDNHDFELAHSEFTDCVDGVFIGNVRNVRFHHNLVDNVSDDGIFLTATTAYDGTTPGGNVRIYQNRFARCLTVFAFGVGHGRQRMTEHGYQTGAGVSIYRNLFDLRSPVMYQQPIKEAIDIGTFGRLAGDHGGPLWEPMAIYQNTILQHEGPFRNYYCGGLGGHLGPGSKRRVLNNLLVQEVGSLGGVLPPVIPPVDKNPPPAVPEEPDDPLADLLDPEKPPRPSLINPPPDAKPPGLLSKVPLPIDFQADGNLQWCYGAPTSAEVLLGRFRRSAAFEASKVWYPAGWTSHDLVFDPLFVHFSLFDPPNTPCDPRLTDKSPAIDAGVPLASDWEDPLRSQDAGRPDIGAFPLGSTAWDVGVNGRMRVDGVAVDAPSVTPSPDGFVLQDPAVLGERFAARNEVKVAMVEGYPAFDAPLLSYVLRRQGATVEEFEKTWLPTTEYAQYHAVVITGDLARAKMEPHQFSADDLKRVRAYLEGGGVLLLTRGGRALFATAEGTNFLVEHAGEKPQRLSTDPLQLLLPKHAWTSHLQGRTPNWINDRNVSPLKATQGEKIIGGPDKATLLRLPLGKGSLIYVGWETAVSLPSGRDGSSVPEETRYEEQLQVLSKIAAAIVDR